MQALRADAAVPFKEKYSCNRTYPVYTQFMLYANLKPKGSWFRIYGPMTRRFLPWFVPKASLPLHNAIGSFIIKPDDSSSSPYILWTWFANLMVSPAYYVQVALACTSTLAMKKTTRRIPILLAYKATFTGKLGLSTPSTSLCLSPSWGIQRTCLHMITIERSKFYHRYGYAFPGGN